MFFLQWHVPASRGPLYSEANSPFLKIFNVGYPLTENLLHVSLPASVQSTCANAIGGSLPRSNSDAWAYSGLRRLQWPHLFGWFFIRLLNDSIKKCDVTSDEDKNPKRKLFICLALLSLTLTRTRTQREIQIHSYTGARAAASVKHFIKQFNENAKIICELGGREGAGERD